MRAWPIISARTRNAQHPAAVEPNAPIVVIARVAMRLRQAQGVQQRRGVGPKYAGGVHPAHRRTLPVSCVLAVIGADVVFVPIGPAFR